MRHTWIHLSVLSSITHLVTIQSELDSNSSPFNNLKFTLIHWLYLMMGVLLLPKPVVFVIASAPNCNFRTNLYWFYFYFCIFDLKYFISTIGLRFLRPFYNYFIFTFPSILHIFLTSSPTFLLGLTRSSIILCNSFLLLAMSTIPSASLKLFMYSPFIKIPHSSHFKFLKTVSRVTLNRFDDKGSPCFTPFSNWEFGPLLI